MNFAKLLSSFFLIFKLILDARCYWPLAKILIGIFHGKWTEESDM